MKLAEALKERSDLTKKLAELSSRLTSNCLVQEGEKPSEDPAALMAEIDRCAARQQELIVRINRTNVATVRDGKSLMDRIAERDRLRTQMEIYRSAVREASSGTSRATRTEIRILPAVDVRALQKRVDDMAKTLREVDNRLQEANWTTELLDD